MTMGGDFHFQNANQYYDNIDKMIKLGNEMYGGEMNFIYSTPACYAKAVKDSGKVEQEKYTEGDFFPYCNAYDEEVKETSFWSGYYASRSQLKADIRGNASFLATCNLLENAGIVSSEATKPLRTVVALTQHHDGITGTEKQHVVDDYNRRLKLAENVCLNEIESQLTQQNEKVTVINSLSFDRIENIDGEKVVIPGFGWVVLDQKMDRKPENDKIENTEFKKVTSTGTPYVLYNEEIGVTIDVNEFITSIKVTNIKTNQEVQTFEHSWKYYLADPGCDYPCIDSGNGTGLSQPSGAYVMRPLDDIEYDSENTETKISSDGNSVNVNQEYISYSWGLNGNKVALDYTIHELPVFAGNFTGREVFSRFEIVDAGFMDNSEVSSSEGSSSKWFTDTNSIHQIERSREITRPMDPIASRYFPVTSRTYLEFDGSPEPQYFTLHTSRAAGVISFKDTQIDIMLHRRTLKDDWKGLSQPMDDKSSVSGILQVGLVYNDGISDFNVVIENDDKSVKELHNPVNKINGHLSTFQNSKTGINGLIQPFCETTNNIETCSLFNENEHASSFFDGESTNCYLLSLEVDTYNENILFMQFEYKNIDAKYVRTCKFANFADTVGKVFNLKKAVKSVKQVNLGGTPYFCEPETVSDEQDENNCYLNGKVLYGEGFDGAQLGGMGSDYDDIVELRLEFEG